MKKNTSCLLLACLFLSVPSGATYAQGWKTSVKKAVSRVTRPAAEEASHKMNAARMVSQRQVQEATARAQKIWDAQARNAALEKAALSSWALNQSLRNTSPLYKSAEKDVAFIRRRASLARAGVTREFIHVNNVNYKTLTQDKNRVFAAADWNEGSRLQIKKLVQTLRENNPRKKIIIASPYFPAGKAPYPSGSYSRFHHENGPDPLIKSLLHEPHTLLVPLDYMPGASVQNHLRAWKKTLGRHYSATPFGQTDAVLVVIAPSKFIEGNAGALRRMNFGSSPWNKDQSVTLSFRTREENNLTDFKWNLITFMGKTPIPAPYVNGWRQNAFVDRTDPQFSDALGTDVIIRIAPNPSVR